MKIELIKKTDNLKNEVYYFVWADYKLALTTKDEAEAQSKYEEFVAFATSRTPFETRETLGSIEI